MVSVAAQILRYVSDIIDTGGRLRTSLRLETLYAHDP